MNSKSKVAKFRERLRKTREWFESRDTKELQRHIARVLDEQPPFLMINGKRIPGNIEFNLNEIVDKLRLVQKPQMRCAYGSNGTDSGEN